MKNKRTKIIATIGPASQSVATLERMIRAGMNAARLNFSHGTHASHRKLFRSVREASRRAKRNVTIIADLQGPKIRFGALPAPLKFKNGDKIELPVTMKGLGRHIKKGDLVLIDDGKMEAEYISGKADTITLKMKSRGELLSHQGVSIPGLHLKGVSALTTKDKADAMFAMNQKANWLVQSFVTQASDVKLLRKLVKKYSHKGYEPKIMVKEEQ